MTNSIKYLTSEKVRQRYFKQFNLFLTQVREYLQECSLMKLEVLEATFHFTVTDITGTYQADIASIRQKNLPEPDNFIADILPFGVGKQGEGILEISGAFSQERLICFSRDLILPVASQPGTFYLIPQRVELEGWHWLENYANKPTTPVTCEQLLDLIDKVNFDKESDEFDGFEEFS